MKDSSSGDNLKLAYIYKKSFLSPDEVLLVATNLLNPLIDTQLILDLMIKFESQLIDFIFKRQTFVPDIIERIEQKITFPIINNLIKLTKKAQDQSFDNSTDLLHLITIAVLKKGDVNLLNLNLKINISQDYKKKLIIYYANNYKKEINNDFFFLLIKKFDIFLPHLMSYKELFTNFYDKNEDLLLSILKIYDPYLKNNMSIFENPLYDTEIQKNKQIFNVLKKNNFLNKEIFSDKNIKLTVLPGPILVPEFHPLLNEYLSWKKAITINQLSDSIFGKNQKRFRKLIMTHITYIDSNQICRVNEISWLFFHYVSKLYNDLDQTYNYLKNLNKIEITKHSLEFILYHLSVPELMTVPNSFKKYTNKFLNTLFWEYEKHSIPKKIISIWNYPNINWKEVFNQKDIDSFILKLNLKSVINKQQNFKLSGQEKLLELNNQKCLNLNISVPLWHYDLIQTGSQLHLCLTIGSYSEKNINKKCNFLFLKDDTNVVAVIELVKRDTNWIVVQAKKMFNKDLESCYLESLESVLKSTQAT